MDLDKGLDNFLMLVKSKTAHYQDMIIHQTSSFINQYSDTIIRVVFVAIIMAVIGLLKYNENDIKRRTRNIPSMKNTGFAAFKQAWDDLDKKDEKTQRLSKILTAVFAITVPLAFSLLPRVGLEFNLLASAALVVIYGLLSYNLFIHFIMQWFYDSKPYKVTPDLNYRRTGLIIFGVSVFFSIINIGSYVLELATLFKGRNLTLLAALIILLASALIIPLILQVRKHNTLEITGEIKEMSFINSLVKDKLVFIVMLLVPVSGLILFFSGFLLGNWLKVILKIERLIFFVPEVVFMEGVIIGYILWTAAEGYLGLPDKNYEGLKKESEEYRPFMDD